VSPPPVTREVLLVPSWLPRAALFAALVTAIVLALLFWTWGEVAAVHLGSQASEGLWQRGAQAFGLVPLIGFLGVSAAVARRLVIKSWSLIACAVAVVLAVAVGLSMCTLIVVENGTSQTVEQFGDELRATLSPGEHLTFLGMPTVPSEFALVDSNPAAEKPASGATNFSLLFKSLLAKERKRVECKPWSATPYFEDEWQGQKECTPDPNTTAPRSHWELVDVVQHKHAEHKDAEKPNPAIDELKARTPVARYSLQPFLPLFEKVEPDFEKAPRLNVVWPLGSRAPYTDLLIQGDQLIRELEVHLPPAELPAQLLGKLGEAEREGLKSQLRPWLPWRTGQGGSPHLRATLRSGRVDVGSLICSVPAGSSEVTVQFLQAGAHVRRVLVQSTSDLTFVSEFEAVRPEMVTHIPICTPNEDFRIEIYVAEGFSTTAWQLRLSGGTEQGGCSSSDPNRCSVAQRVSGVQVHLADDRIWGALNMAKKAEERAPCNVVGGVRAEAAPHPIKRVVPAADAVKGWSWDRAVSSTGNETRPKEFLVCSADGKPQGPTYRITLTDDSFREVEVVEADTRVTPLKPRICFFDSQARLLERKKGSCKSARQKFENEWKDLRVPGCSLDSQVCE
jgi:hypothetical protein